MTTLLDSPRTKELTFVTSVKGKRRIEEILRKQIRHLLMHSLQIHNDMLLQAAVLPLHNPGRGGRPDDPGNFI